MQNQWWYASCGTQHGPVSRESLQALLQCTDISAATYVWTRGQSGWKPLAEVPELATLMQGVSLDPTQPLSLVAGDARQSLSSAMASPQATASSDGGARHAGAELSPASPSRRFWARLVDIKLLLLLVGLLASALGRLLIPAFALWLAQPGSTIVFNVVLLPVCLLAEGAVFALFGNTPGKCLFNVKVSTAEGTPPSMRQYQLRQVGVWWYGLGAGVPIIGMITALLQYWRVSDGRATRYDAGRFVISATPLGWARSIKAVIVIFILASAYDAL